MSGVAAFAGVVARGASARGASAAEAAALAKAVQPRRLYFDTSPGLEPVLERELRDGLGLTGKWEIYKGGVALEAPESNLWHAILQSRVLQGARIGVGTPFHAGYESTLKNYAAGVPWSEYIWFQTQAGAPPIKVTSEKSRLFHTDVIERAITEAIESLRRNQLKRKLQQTEDGKFYGKPETPKPPSPTVYVELDANECKLSVSCTEKPHRRAYTCAVDSSEVEVDDDAEGPAKGSAWLLGEAHAAACVLKSPMLRNLEQAAEAGHSLRVWDPFCGRGTMLLEALGIALGVPPGSPSQPLPFAEFPGFDEIRFGEVVRSLQVSPHPAISHLSLLGSHDNAELIQHAEANLRGFVRAMPRPRTGPLSLMWKSADAAEYESRSSSDPMADTRLRLPCPVSFRQADSPADLLDSVRSQPTMILTNVPYGNKADGRRDQRRYEEFGKMLKAEAELGYLRGVFCLSAKEDFKRRTGLEWRTELRFTCSGVPVELLQWTGRAAAGAGYMFTAPRTPQAAAGAADQKLARRDEGKFGSASALPAFSPSRGSEASLPAGRGRKTTSRKQSQQ